METKYQFFRNIQHIIIFLDKPLLCCSTGRCQNTQIGFVQIPIGNLTYCTLSLANIELTKGGLISEGILTLVPLPTKSVKSLSRKFKFRVPIQAYSNFLLRRVICHLLCNGTKVKITSEIKPPLSSSIWVNRLC